MPQPGEPQDVLAPPAVAAIFLVATVRPGGEDAVRGLLPDIAGLTRAVGFRSPEGGLSCVTGIGAELWDRLYGPPRPAGLHPFRVLGGAVHTAVSTPGDLLFHLRARRMDLCFELAGQLMNRLARYVDVADEVHGFRYFDERDLMGFVDGTESPKGRDGVVAVRVGDEDPAFAGGSYVVVQKYVHDLQEWDALPVEAQELAMGRTKLNDIELPDEMKPSNSHVVLNTITDADGNQRQIVRDNMPFGTVGAREFGTYFIGYTASVEVIERMLENMFIGDPPGNHDRILDFSTPVTGGLFFVPTADFLDDPSPQLAAAAAAAADKPGPDAQAAEEPAARAPTSPDDGSLGIGSLKGHGTS
jgi:putative iron-dependent peroxidase